MDLGLYLHKPPPQQVVNLAYTPSAGVRTVMWIYPLILWISGCICTNLLHSRWCIWHIHLVIMFYIIICNYYNTQSHTDNHSQSVIHIISMYIIALQNTWHCLSLPRSLSVCLSLPPPGLHIQIHFEYLSIFVFRKRHLDNWYLITYLENWIF